MEQVQEGASKTKEYLSGDAYNEFVDQVKTAVGADASLWSKIKHAVSPQRTVMDKVKGALSGATGYTKDDFINKIYESLEDMDPTHRDSIMTRVSSSSLIALAHNNCDLTE